MGKRRKKRQVARLAVQTFFFGIIVMVLLMHYAFVEHTPTFPPQPKSYDVIVVGQGLAADLAAITAADKGALVLYLQMSEPEADTSSVYLPVFWAADSSYQRIAGIEYLPETMANEIYRQGEFFGSYPQILALSLASAESLRSLTTLTGQQFIQLDPDNPGLHWGEEDAVKEIALRLAEKLETRDLIEKANMQPQSLLTEKGQVVGLVAIGPDGHEEKIYSRAVILADGGFGSNLELLRKYSGIEGVMKRPEAGHLGRGLQLAQEIGARTVALDLVHLEVLAVGTGKLFTLPQSLVAEAYIFAADGRRLELQEGESFTDLLQQNGGKAFLVFTGEQPALVPFKPTVVKDQEFLAFALKTSPSVLKEQLAELPPPYQLLSVGLVALTPGGLAVNENYQVMAAVEPITGLYACGELTGGLHGRAAICQLFFTETIVSSLLAGENAAHYALR
ncbi:MAG: FAD-binding protein [Firmicutes bacterium]|nr:FAD-binding protein [Bacillota bacterium]